MSSEPKITSSEMTSSHLGSTESTEEDWGDIQDVCSLNVEDNNPAYDISL